MTKRLTEKELDAVREASRRQGRDAAGQGPLNLGEPPEDLRPLSGLELPRGLPLDVLTAGEIVAVSEAWRSGYREVMSEREAGGEPPESEPLLWWSPAVAGGWLEGWRWQDAGARAGRRSGPVAGEALARDAEDGSVREAASGGAAPEREGVDWRRAAVRRETSDER